MNSSRIIRTTAVLALAGLAVGMLAVAPAQAKKKKKKPAACAAYTPGELGAGQPITVVTDAATAEAPVSTTLATDAGLGSSNNEGASGDTGPTSHAYVNVQVDSAAASRGLFVRVEFQAGEDYDLYLRSSDGTAVAYAAGFNEVPVDPVGGTGIDGTGHGGHSEQTAEQIDGFDTPDCTGYTLDLVSGTTPGGDVTVTYWLGDAAPAA